MEDALFWLKNNLFRKAAMRQYKRAILSDILSDEELNNINWMKRKAIVMHAYNHSLFYTFMMIITLIHPCYKKRLIGI